MRRIGFTGTQFGMTAAQRERLSTIIPRGSEFHHGDCVGADAEAHRLAEAQDCRIVIHPSSLDAKRAFCQGAEVRAVKPPLERNHDIVDETEELIVVPRGFKQVRRSGTWATLRYAARLERPYRIIWPDGQVFSDAGKMEV